MHLYRRARVPLACLPASLHSAPLEHDPRLEPWRECDILVDGSRISAVAAVSESAPALPTTDLGGCLVWPGFLDVHTHLDKAHTWERAPNPTGEFWDAIKALHADSAKWTEEDVYRRANFALQRAWSHGTVALRTHLDTGNGVGAASHAVLQRLREEWAGKITLQTVALFGLEAFVSGQSPNVMALAHKHGTTALGGFPQPNLELPRQLDYLMAAANELRVGLDLHVDESGLAGAECLRATAEAVLRNQFKYPVACGHNCSLAVQNEARAASTIELVKEAGVSIISLPLCNLYLQGRSRAQPTGEGLGNPRTPRWRGITLLHEFMDAGVTVACASDNVRDAFYAWGDLDVLEVYAQSIRIAHLDTRLEASPEIVTTGPALIMGLADKGQVAPGFGADLVVLEARTFNELLARPLGSRKMITGEALRVPEPPPYSALGR